MDVYSFVRNKIDILDKDETYSRTACAKLRRAVGKPPGSIPNIWDITLQGAPEEWDSRNENPSKQEWAVHTALTLYALHRQGKDRSMNAEKVSFGTAISRLIQGDENKMESVRRRFNAVATSEEFSELAHHARSLVQLMKAADIPMDYPLFAKDLFIFQLPGFDDGVRLRWGEDFYKFAKNDENENDNNKENEKRSDD